MNGDTLLHRQVNPAWIQDGRVTSQLFKPTRKDGDQVSVYNGDEITAREAWIHFTDELGFSSRGVMAVAVAECSDLALSADADPLPDSPSHVVIKFDDFSRSEIEAKAKKLKRLAEQRGWQYQAETE